MEEMDVGNKNSSSTSSSDAEDQEENEMEKRAVELEQQVSANVYLYDAHVELIDLYRKLGDLISMRAAYERFSKAYPLTADLWLQWIVDEIKIANTANEKKKIVELFKKAVQDYHSVKLWEEYCQFIIGNYSINEVREVFEMGLNYVGLHVAEGSLLWDMYREFEMAHLSLADAESDQFNEQLKRVVDIYCRQLRIPLQDMENTMKEFQQFVDQLPDDHGIDTKQIEWGYNKALKQLDSYKVYEEDLLRCEDDHEAFAIYMKYIKAIDDPVMKVCTYERAVARLCLNVELWFDYCQYAIKLGEVALAASEKSIRNCSWAAELWDLRLKILEINGVAESEIVSCFEESLRCVGSNQHLGLWRAYIEYVRRQNDNDKLDKVFSQAKEQLVFDTEQLTKLLKLQADLKSKSDYVASKGIWNEIMQIPQNKTSATLWMQYICLEKQCGTTQNVRNLYEKAMKNCFEWAEYLSEEWLMYEQEMSSVQDVIKCMMNRKRIMKEVDKRYKNNTKNYNNNVNNSNQKSKRNLYDSQDNNVNETELRQLKKQKRTNVTHANERREVIEKPCIKVVQVPTDIDPLTTIFISNITSDVTDKKLKTLFPKCTKVTVPTDKHGISRCFAYVVFKEQDDVNEALQRDREPIDGRPMFISKCIKDKAERQAVFKYENKREPKKLFIKGLPLSYDKEMVGNIFKSFDPVDVRLVTKFNGKSKGLAYVEFATEDIAKRAMEATDNKEFEGFTISVAVSSPPSKPKAMPPNRQSSNVPSSHPKSRLQFLPRCIETNKNMAHGPAVAKSNEDFRIMINQKH